MNEGSSAPWNVKHIDIHVPETFFPGPREKLVFSLLCKQVVTCGKIVLKKINSYQWLDGMLDAIIE